MFAIIKTGGKQYRVKEGDVIEVERLKGEKGDKVILDNVLSIKKGEAALIGKPRLESAKVEAKILEQKRDHKIIVFKYTKRKGFAKKRGHRQSLSKIKIEKISE